MKSDINKIVGVAGMFLLLFIPFVHAEDLESWLKGSDAQAPKTTTSASTAPTVTGVVAGSGATVNNTVVKGATIGGHSLDDIIYKVSRAKTNLENYGSDLNGHGPKAIEYLNQALEELKKAR